MAADTASRARSDRRSMQRVVSRRTRSPRLLHFGPFCCCLILCLIVSNGLTAVHAVPLAQQDSTSTTHEDTSTSTPTASPGATKSDTLLPTASSTQSASSSSSTTLVPGTVVTDSPLVRTSLSHSLASISSFSSNQSSIASSILASDAHVPSSTSKSPTIYPSPPSDGDDDDSDDAPTNSTYNSLLNFYFLILGAAIAAALVGWWCWRRRRKGKNTRDRHRGLEALRRDLELGRLRRGFLGVVGRGGNSNPSQNSSEELPAYPSVGRPAAALTRPPAYDEAVSRDRRVSNPGLHTIQEEGSIASRSQTPDGLANTSSAADRPPDTPLLSKDTSEQH